MKTDKKGTCVYEKDIPVSHKGQGAATNREKGQGVTRTRAGAAPCNNGLARTLLYACTWSNISAISRNCPIFIFINLFGNRFSQTLNLR